MVHAVTGAGKTEMMYQVVATAIKAGKSSLYCYPKNRCLYRIVRKNEGRFFLPHLFASWRIGPYFRTPLVIATTHQLLKFYQAFDLLIIDEVDAFPYVDNPILYKAAQNAIKKRGTLYI